MATQLFANNATGALASGISNSATSLMLTTGLGALFPTPSGGDWFLLTLTQATGPESSWEIVKCTARAGDTLTVVRAQEGTTGLAWASAKAELRITAGTLVPAVAGGANGLLLGADKSKLDATSGTNTGDETLTTIKSKLGISTLSGANTGDQTSIAGITGTMAQFNAAITDADMQAALVSGTNIKTINLTSLLGTGDISVGASVVRSARATNTILVGIDKGILVDVTSGTFTQTITAAATLGSGWYCWMRNTGTGVVTVDPNASETVGGAATAALNPGDFWQIQCDGSNFNLQRLAGSNSQTLTTGSGNFTVPSGVTRIYVECWGSGAGGNATATAPYNDYQGGGGAGYCSGWINTTPGAAIAYQVGAAIVAGAGGTLGNNTSFGTFTANGGGNPSGYYYFGGTASGGTFNQTGGCGTHSYGSFLTQHSGGSHGTPGGAANWQGPNGITPGGGAAGGGTSGAGQIYISWV